MRSDTFKDFVLEQLEGLGELDCRSMFGGYALYNNGEIFGIVFKGRAYFKTDPANRVSFIEKGMKPFRPSAKMTLKSYYEVPIDILEDSGQAVEWAKAAAAVSQLKQLKHSKNAHRV